ncbi:MAG: hypothetical protein VB064_04915 [Oscillospiraceae bacterium]|nr:hypothetical protein [Oscillospiraceae bacterium]
MLLFFIWLLLKTREDGQYLGMLLSRGKYLIASIFIIAIFDIVLTSSISAQTRTFILLFMAYSIMLAYRKGHQAFVKVLLILLLADYCYTVFMYFRLLAADPMYARTFSSGNQEGIAGVGGYIFIYATTFLFSYLAGVILKKSTWRKAPVLLICLSIVQFILILRAMYYIAIITAISCLVYALLPISPKHKFSIAVILAIVMYLLKNPLADLILSIANSISSELTANKLLEIAKYLTADSLSNFSPTSRIGLVATSIRAFLEHPLLGVYNFKASALYIRGHSGVFDLISNYGIIRATPIIIFLYSALKEIVRSAPSFSKDAIKLSIATFVFVGVFDPIFSSQILTVVFVVIPLLSENIYCTMISAPADLSNEHTELEQSKPHAISNRRWRR